jgi:hypothetical protein
MPLNPTMWAMTLGELGLWSALCLLFWKKNLQKRFPAMGWYLALRAISAPVFLAILYIQSMPLYGPFWGAVYFFVYCAVYLASSILLFFVAVEIFSSALAGFSGLVRFGTVIFRWAAVASILISISTVSFSRPDWRILPDIMYRMMRSVSIMELCLLAFLCISMNALKLSGRDHAFGIALGLGIFSSGDFILAAFQGAYGNYTDWPQVASEGITLFALSIWLVYAALPEPVRKPVVVAANSTIYRWNEIASALGHKSPQVVVQQPANSFFLTDVEKVVEKVLNRTALREGESRS